MTQGEAMIAAALLTNCSLSGTGAAKGVVTPDGTIDPNEQKLNLEVWEEFRIFYHAVVGASKDSQSWPLPAGGDASGGGGNLVQSVMTALQSAQSGSGPLLAEGKQLLDMVKQYMGGGATLPTAPAAVQPK